MVHAFSASGWLLYPLHAIVYARVGLWHPKLDIPVVIASVLVALGSGMVIDWHIVAGWK